MIGKGMAGGMCVIGSRQGSLAAIKMLEQIAKKDSSRIPVLTDSPNEFLFDNRELERHQISMDILPVSAKVRFSPSTQLQISKDLFQYGSIAIGIVLLLLGLLLWINHRRLHLSRRLLAKEQDLRLLIETQSDLIVKVDMAGRFEFVSPSYCKLFQVPEEKLIGSTFQVRVHPDDLSSTMKAMEVLQAPPYKVYLEQRVMLADGIRWLGWNDSGITDNQGKLVAIIGVGRDITERKRLEVERERMIEELKRKNYELERYAYTVSHDLRSPLVTILGFAQEMELDLQAGDIGELQESLERIKSAGTRMHALLEAILQLSRIGHTTLDPKPLALSRAVEETLANLEGKIKESKASIILEPSADQWPEILGDYSRTVEVLQNLVENAMKYRLSDQMLVIRITAYVRATCVEVCIEDNGVGISSNNLEQIFQLFHKLDPKTPGVGFGLALCKQVMESLGGSIWAESDGLGKGSRFWLRFPST
jgi:PAS domain S-box-containing protein